MFDLHNSSLLEMHYLKCKQIYSFHCNTLRGKTKYNDLILRPSKISDPYVLVFLPIINLVLYFGKYMKCNSESEF